MAVAAMRAEDGIDVLQVRANARGDRFLADIRVASAVDQSFLMAAGQLFLRLSDKEHRAVER